jgi:thioredoxin 1
MNIATTPSTVRSAVHFHGKKQLGQAPLQADQNEAHKATQNSNKSLGKTLLAGLAALNILPAAIPVGVMMTQATSVVRAEDKKEVTSKVVAVTDDNFEKEVLQSDVPIIIKFGAEWCAPCRKMDPELDKLSLKEKYDKTLKVARLDIDKSPKMREKYGITSIPTTFVFKKDKDAKEATQRETISGYMDLAALEKLADKYVEKK